MRVAVLCYHSQNIQGSSYALNDHIAFEHDIKRIIERNIAIISINQLAKHLKGESILNTPIAVVLTCDDGTTLDWLDYEHPEFGHQKSFRKILLNELGENLPRAAMTSFVIACPTARKHIDQGCYGGAALSSDDWWLEAANCDYWAIENHSWNHMHACLPFRLPHDQPLGQFYTTNNYLRANKQIVQASRLINNKISKAGKTVNFFAYPYGHAGEYLKNYYFPQYRAQHSIEAAFTTTPGFVTMQSNIYALPRFVCGEAWKSPDQFNSILQKLEKNK